MPLPNDTITLTRKDSRVTLDMSEQDWEHLLFALGCALGAASNLDRSTFYGLLDLTNRLNQGNPESTPYEIPAENRS